MPLLLVLTVIFLFKMKQTSIIIPLNSMILPLFAAALSLQYYHKLIDISEYLSPYSIKLYIGISTSMSLALSTCVLFILLM